MYRLLSYPLSPKTPLYGKTAPVSVNIKRRQTKEGCCVSEARVSFSNHSGTHVDAPKHFYPEGKAIGQCDISDLIFVSPKVIDCPKGERELVVPDDLRSIPSGCDMLILRTGFYKYRGRDKYRTDNPGVSAAAAEYVRRNFPSVMALGIDAISVSCFQKREEGRKAHRVFLGREGYDAAPVFLVEDMDLSGDLSGLKKVFIVPLFFKGVDSMTCTVIGEFD